MSYIDGIRPLPANETDHQYKLEVFCGDCKGHYETYTYYSPHSGVVCGLCGSTFTAVRTIANK